MNSDDVKIQHIKLKQAFFKFANQHKKDFKLGKSYDFKINIDLDGNIQIIKKTYDTLDWNQTLIVPGEGNKEYRLEIKFT